VRLLPIAVLVFSLTTAGCTGGGSPKPDGAHAGEAPVDPVALVDACAKHLELLHRIRLARELGPELAKLAGPIPTAEEIKESQARVKAAGLGRGGEDMDRAAPFSELAAPALADAGYRFIAWTRDPNDVGLAKIRGKRPQSWKEIWGRTVAYEVVLLDGFRVLDYPQFRENALEHKETARDVPRHREALVVIDAAAIERDVQAIKADGSPDKADLRAVLSKLSIDDVIREVELREAAYLRFQDEVGNASRLDQVVTWLEIQEGNPDLALTSVVCAGDRPDEQRRAGAVQAIVLKIAANDAREEKAEVLSLPHDARAKKLKELSPHFLRAELEKR
jgi:hypothetical protein